MATRAVNDPRIRPYVAARQPMAGGPGSAEDVAEAALYLCEPASRFVTGSELVVNGGWCVSEGYREGTANREGAAPSEPFSRSGSPGGSPSRGISGAVSNREGEAPPQPPART